MSPRKPEPDASRLGRLVRRWRLDRNPLRRAADRAETAVLALLAAAFLIGTPFAALATGAWMHGTARQEQLAQQASQRQATAVVRAVAAPVADGGQLAWEAQARWRAPDGPEVTHEVPVPPDTPVGAALRVWTNRRGDLATAPLLDSQVASETGSGEALGLLGSVSVLTVAGALALGALNKRRMAAWDADWHVTGPRWTTRA